MITGAMPKWRQFFHRFACVFMCLLFGALGLLGLRIMVDAPERPARFFGILFAIFGVIAISGMIRYLRQIISAFRYDGSKLEFRAMGNAAPQTVALTENASIREWRGKGGELGFRLQLRDRRKFYLEYSVSNSATLVNLLRTHMI